MIRFLLWVMALINAMAFEAIFTPTTTTTTTTTMPEPIPTTTLTTLLYIAPATTAPSRTSEWAIPAYIVACESGGDWDAENASGAAGPYQLMPEHFGGESALNQSRAAQHAKAAELWDNGNGASHWEACL